MPEVRTLGIGTVVALFLIFLALLGTANETRFQGCAARQDRALIANVLAKRTVASRYDCSRVPFK